ncbi:helix-turn-helix domain-containing protein [Microbispora sp. ATCC PTA-5024]|uniref:helix-turn-helix domain-containing protein n=1 Tax=Microbispora sp. ATCC PTA-5024 TaxID=316330 RepID=UPI0003DC1625|nr:pyridoxamine 5'-phosphate oxidase family protein [Microbispora sp. ATCC PTA-5024]ETK32851.1 hypothetical protein MPTA5024_27575 [Microbispora sp. ATCC PTA-5024]
MQYSAINPGDLGRRIAYHRKRLGLTREQVAERAGMVSGFVEYLEERPSSLTEGTLLRLAAALETTADDLLGGGADRPAGKGPAAARPVLCALEPDECLRLIASGGVGRVAFTGPSGPIVLPVNFRLHRGAVVFRTRFGGAVDQNVRDVLDDPRAMTGFEIDHIDEASREGWSVMIQGPAQLLTPEDVPSDLEPWPGGERGLCVRIVPRHIAGRRIRSS